ncbi:hypothetical protein, partial [Sphingomonas sp. CLY1604]|uniref:hypothetical protein n=1 Tax=Sphingomonas sp. CLY1604 TaxID=3457786 RepID=UPI003FD8919B
VQGLRSKVVLCCGWTVVAGPLEFAGVPVTLVWFKIDACTFDVLVIVSGVRRLSSTPTDESPGLSLMVCPLKRE